MFILTYKINFKDLNEKIEDLQIEEIYNVYYDAPLEITTNDYGYGYFEKDVDFIDLKIAYENEDISLDEFKIKVNTILKSELSSCEEVNYDYEEYNLPTISISDNWILAHPDVFIDEKHTNKISFISQGAFGTGLHETTKDLLDIILNKLEIKNKSVLDIGTGSGILSIASSIVGAKKVTALDIRDVREEVTLNAHLNGLYNIDVIVGNALEENLNFDNEYEWIYINIGGEETQMFMNFIKSHLAKDGSILVSGLVEWSFDKVKSMIESYGYTLLEKYQTNEWITAIFK